MNKSQSNSDNELTNLVKENTVLKKKIQELMISIDKLGMENQEIRSYLEKPQSEPEFSEEAHDLYKEVDTFQDLLDINVKFLKGEIPMTLYHSAPVDEETIPLLDDLIRLNSLGFYSTCGQPAISDDNYEQRSFISGIIEHKGEQMFHELISYLDENGLYYVISFRDKILAKNVPFNKKGCFGLTRDIHSKMIETSLPYDITSFDEIYSIHKYYPRIAMILRKCVAIDIIGKDYGVDVELEKKLIKFFEK